MSAAGRPLDGKNPAGKVEGGLRSEKERASKWRRSFDCGGEGGKSNPTTTSPKGRVRVGD